MIPERLKAFPYYSHDKVKLDKVLVTVVTNTIHITNWKRSVI